MTAPASAPREIRCQPFTDQRAGTAGLRKKVAAFRQPHYLECFIQSVFDTLKLEPGATLVLGGDGRFFNREAIAVIISMAEANGMGRLIIGRDGLLSTPAASHLIRLRQAAGGIILTASHNPGGPDGDFGIKFNMANGGQAPEQFTDAVYARSQVIDRYRMATLEAVDLGHTGTVMRSALTVEVIDPIADYVQLMQQLFDFELMRGALEQGTQIHFDAMNAVTGPYAKRIFCDLLGAPQSSVSRATPLEDFGGIHPDPNPAEAPHLVELANSDAAPDLIAASDGDGDRNMILGRGMLVSPGDSLAIMLANLHTVPGYAAGVPGVARSMPTSRAVDRVATELGIPCYETPTGWRFFSNLLQAGKIGLCGEESFGTSSAHTGEKDGLWAVLYWLNMMARLQQPVETIVRQHWARFGRCFFQRRDYFIADTAQANALMDELGAKLITLTGRTFGKLVVTEADVFTYHDPVDGSVSGNQGIRIFYANGGRSVIRLSGTGTAGATLRVYLDRQVDDPAQYGQTPDQLLHELGEAAAEIARIAAHTGLTAPTATI